jgi:hypothetical protein
MNYPLSTRPRPVPRAPPHPGPLPHFVAEREKNSRVSSLSGESFRDGFYRATRLSALLRLRGPGKYDEYDGWDKYENYETNPIVIFRFADGYRVFSCFWKSCEKNEANFSSAEFGVRSAEWGKSVTSPLSSVHSHRNAENGGGLPSRRYVLASGRATWLVSGFGLPSPTIPRSQSCLIVPNRA